MKIKTRTYQVKGFSKMTDLFSFEFFASLRFTCFFHDQMQILPFENSIFPIGGFP